MGIAEDRIQYETAGLDLSDLHDDPVEQLLLWYRQAESAGIAEPNAVVISTVDTHGHPDSRMVLARDISARGVTFYTNRESTKGTQLADNANAAGLFPWIALHRQVRIRGRVTWAPDAESDAYFASRPRASQIGAWASPQSQPLANRDALEAQVEAMTNRFQGSDVPRPPHWGGYVLSIDEIEFWQGRPSRLHDRFVYRRVADTDSVNNGWNVQRLAP